MKAQGKIPVIPDLKAFSPKEGNLFNSRSITAIAKELKLAGAPVLSVVTEENNFHGSLDNLKKVVDETGLPVLRKDFIACEKDIDETKTAGAKAILLMCCMHNKKDFRRLYEYSHKIGLEVLVETHTKEELAFAETLYPKLLGINNRNITDLELDNGTVERTAALLSNISKNSIIISESGLLTRNDILKAVKAGSDAVLIGTALLRADNIGKCYRQFSKGE